MRQYDVKDVTDGVGPTGLPNHWAITAIYRDTNTGETWINREAVKCVPPSLGRIRVNSGAWQKVGEIEQTDPRSVPQGRMWKPKAPQKPQGPTAGPKPKASEPKAT